MSVAGRVVPWLLLLCAGSAACTAFAPKAEYQAYREVRLADGLPDRLRAMQRYVSSYPTGRWAEELEAARKAEDARAFEAGKDTREGLTFYLEAFPDGAFASQAHSRLQAIAMIEQQRAEEARQAELAAEQRRQREQEARRTWVGRFAKYWVTVLAGLSNWGAPIPAVAAENPEFSAAFGQAPRPRCTKTECVKYYTAQYAIPIPGATRLERSMQMILRLRMDAKNGQLQRAEVLMPGWGFSRWAEVEGRKLVVDSDPESRGQAVAWALAQLEPVVTQLGAGVSEEPSFVLEEIPRPAVGPTGEATDTTAADPSKPGTGVHQAGAATGERGVSELLQAGEGPADDMVIAPIVVDKRGRAHTTDAQPAAPPSEEGLSLDADSFRAAAEEENGGSGQGDGGGEGGEMVLDTLAVGEGGKAVISELPQTAETAAAPVTRAFRVGNLRVVLFAAGGAAPAPAYDGIVIERVGR